jgi:hypothetical protein
VINLQLRTISVGWKIIPMLITNDSSFSVEQLPCCHLASLLLSAFIQPNFLFNLFFTTLETGIDSFKCTNLCTTGSEKPRACNVQVRRILSLLISLAYSVKYLLDSSFGSIQKVSLYKQKYLTFQEKHLTPDQRFFFGFWVCG